MELFDKLGAEVEETWREQNYNEDLFPAIAADALRRADLPSKLSAWDVIGWTLEQPELPPQKDPTATFGDPPITVFVSPRFYIDVYFWLNGTTAIHQHGFCGAFQVLLGSSIHSWYEFDRKETVNAYMETGEMRLKVCELFKVGDIQEIRAGRQYIHALFHLDQPSVTIVVRTDKSPLYLPQFSYHKPSIATDPFYEHQTTTRKLQSIGALLQVDHPDSGRFVSELLEKSDFHSSFITLSYLHNALRSRPLGQLFNLDASADGFAQFLEIVVRRHGTKAETLSEVFKNRDAVNEIVRRRSYVTNAEHRFFFALLLNVDDRETIFSLIRSRYQDEDPVEKVLDWTHELSQTRVVGANIPNALGIENFNDIDLSILENLLRGKSDDEALLAVRSEYGEGKLASVDLNAKLGQIRTSVIFRPLLAERS